jgi:hypothetical protein
MLIQAGAGDLLNGSVLIFPALEVFHILGFALLIGSVALVDFRMLGIGLTRYQPAELSKTMFPWLHLGLAFILFSGPLMYATDPDMYYLNWSFIIKMIALAAALAFHYTVHRKTVKKWSPEHSGQAVAVVSLTLRAAVVFGGICIAFVNEGL